jgi:hypothetical protein
MCKAFSCIIEPNKKVTWKMGIDSHDKLLEIAGLPDDTKDPAKIRFCRIEIAPKNGSYLEPDEWVFKIDMDITPTWWTLDHKTACLKVHKKWLKALDKILVRKPIVHPFKITPPKEITEEHLSLLREWASVRDSVWASVWASVGASVRDSVWDSVWASVGASVRAYTGSFFILPRTAWQYTERIQTSGYPFESLVKLWDLGLVPSFDGKIWGLHGGPSAAILWQGTIEDAKNQIK